MSKLTGHLLRAAIFLLVLAAAAAGWLWWQDRGQKPIAQRYEVEAVSYGELTQTVTANGTLNPVTLVNVWPTVVAGCVIAG